ncbi:DnaB-like helicase C-terminal domain-containing protein [Clostridium perfringens]|uniref:DnaB-like helicase C-terminal domain-containing protein n=1 Tax=Clostridium perfringens TaxID=1502 RepID=UPI002972EF3E|nr:DnaB-like helicase C-terminal domain-containing protein [Clostridium perfringens]MDM0495357.1 DnaB-like helicase C-terminal domain-containing protein [Clostridium perfringens]MDM0781071.1 DnaB-like helicase C-terminal domain-containing protein [Clostridium perfringens]
MANIESKLLSKVIDEKSVAVLSKYNITENDFITQSEAFKFIKSYVKEFGEVPAYTEVVAECSSFDYVPEVPDNVAYMCKKIKSDNAKRRSFELLQKEASEKFNQLSGSSFIEWLYDEAGKIKEVACVDSHAGTNFATNGAERKSMYLEAKEQGSGLYIETPYSLLNTWLNGGLELGDYVLLQAYTNRGKSWIASDIGIGAWRKGNGVLHYSPELSKKQQLQRLDTLDGHFRNSLLKNGQLTGKEEQQYLEYLDEFNEDIETPYIIKTMGDLPRGLSVGVIEADLQANENIKMVIIDGFNLMNHKGNDGNRNNMTKTSRRLRQLFGKYGVVGVVVHQVPTSAEKENRSEDESGARMVEPPRLDQYSESVAVIQDACTILNFDQCDGVGKIRLAKARTPNVDKILDLHVDFDMGYIKEASPIDFI